MLGKRQNLIGYVLFFWDKNDSTLLGNWLLIIQGNALHLQHSSSPISALLMPLHPSRKQYIVLKHQELITQQCSITPQKMTTQPQKPQDSRAAHVVNEVRGRKECNGATASCFFMRGWTF
jgi:hypothetical protein